MTKTINQYVSTYEPNHQGTAPYVLGGFDYAQDCFQNGTGNTEEDRRALEATLRAHGYEGERAKSVVLAASVCAMNGANKSKNVKGT